MLFTYDIVLLNEIKNAINNLQVLNLVKQRTEYLKCQLSGLGKGTEDEVTIINVVMPQLKKFRYQGSIIQEKWDIDGESNGPRVGRQEWKNASGLLCDKKIHIVSKKRAYPMVGGPALLYRASHWPIKKSYV